MKKNYFGLFNSRDIDDENVFNDIKEGLAEANEIPIDKVPDEWVYENFNDYLDNLDIETGGYIVAFCSLGLWSRNLTLYRQGNRHKNIS